MNGDIGLVGLGTMGAALALNIAEKGYRIAVHNRTAGVAQRFAEEAGDLGARIVPCETLADLVAAIEPPRAVLLLVPAGPPVDNMIAGLRPLMEPTDVIVDAGNANFRYTTRRAAEAELLGVPYLGIGVSGGEDGARRGPSIMGGGSREAWIRIEPVMRAIAARHQDEPCAAWLGSDGAGHAGCTPTKTLVAAARAAHVVRRAAEYGVHTAPPSVDMGRVRARMRSAVEASRDGLEAWLSGKGG